MTSGVSTSVAAHVGGEGDSSPAGDDSASPGGSGRPLRPGLVVGVGAGALVASCAVVAAGGSPAALLLVAVATTTLALRSWISTTLALSAVLVGACALLAVCMRLWPGFGLPVSSMLVLPAVASAGALVLVWRHRSASLAVTRPDLVLGALLAAPSVLQVAAVPLVRWLSGSPKLAWMMNNDSTWNLISARFIIEDGGLDPASHRNPAPLANEVVALFAAPGRAEVGPTDLLAHDLFRGSEVLLLMVAATSLLAGLLVASGIPASRRWSRAVLALVAAMIPWTWSLAGTVFLYGFWNTLPAAVLLLAAWGAWTSSERHPVASSGLLALIGTGLLAAWAPLVLVPAALGAAVVAWRWRPHVALRGTALVAWLAPLLVLVAYAGTVTRPDAAVGSGSLAAEGGFPAFGEHLPPVFWLVPLAVLLLLSAWSTVRTDLVGALVVGLAGAIGTYYLMGQRAGSPAGPWGYYPQKFAWTLAFLAPLIVLLSVRGALASKGLVRAQRGTLVLGATLLSCVLLIQVPPVDPRPVTGENYPIAHRTPDYRLSSMLPVVSMLLPNRSSALDPAATTLLRFADADNKVIVSGWTNEPGDSSFINFWLLQLSVDKADEFPRPYAPILDSVDPAQLCTVVASWGGDVIIHTPSRTLDKLMKKKCAGEDYEVRVH